MNWISNPDYWGDYQYNPLGYAIESLIEHYKTQMRAAGYVLGELIGTGDHGSVYKAEPGKVWKFTSREEELVLARFIINHPHPGFPTIYSVRCDLENEIHSDLEDICGIHREDIPDYLISGRDDVITCNILRILSDIPHTEESDTEAAAKIARYLSARRDIIPPAQERFLRDYADFVLWCKKHGIYLEDMGRDNFGKRDDGTFVVRDFSYAFPDRPEDWAELEL